MPSVEVELRGDWEATRRALQLLPVFIRTLQGNVAHGIANEYYEALRKHFREQDLPLAPLSRWYVEWKAQHGLDTRILIATGQMYDSIKEWPYGLGKVFVGIRQGEKHRQSGIDVALMALAHEYGDPAQNLPARPVYRLTVEELKDKLQEVLNEIVRKTRIEVFGK